MPAFRAFKKPRLSALQAFEEYGRKHPGTSIGFERFQQSYLMLHSGRPVNEISRLSGANFGTVKKIGRTFQVRTPEEEAEIAKAGAGWGKRLENSQDPAMQKTIVTVREMVRDKKSLRRIEKRTGIDERIIRRIAVEEKLRSRQGIEKIGRKSTAEERKRKPSALRKRLKAILGEKEIAGNGKETFRHTLNEVQRMTGANRRSVKKASESMGRTEEDNWRLSALKNSQAKRSPMLSEAVRLVEETTLGSGEMAERLEEFRRTQKSGIKVPASRLIFQARKIAGISRLPRTTRERQALIRRDFEEAFKMARAKKGSANMANVLAMRNGSMSERIARLLFARRMLESGNFEIKEVALESGIREEELRPMRAKIISSKKRTGRF